MKKPINVSGKSSVSKAKSYKDIGAFWDEHDATEFGEQIDAEFEVDIHSQLRYCPIDSHFIKKPTSSGIILDVSFKILKSVPIGQL